MNFEMIFCPETVLLNASDSTTIVGFRALIQNKISDSKFHHLFLNHSLTQ